MKWREILLSLATVASASKVLFEYNGTEPPTTGLRRKFEHVIGADGLPLGRDGKLSATAEGLVINSNPFNYTVHSNQDCYKFQLVSRDQTVLDGVLSITMTGSVRTFGVENHPFRDQVSNPQSDPRLAAASTTAYIDNGDSFSFVLTNQKIYAGINAIRRGATTSVAQYLIPLLVNTQAGKQHTFKLIFDTPRKRVLWYVDGQQMHEWWEDSDIANNYCVTRLGAKINPVFSRGKSIKIGFGTLSALMSYAPQGNELEGRKALVKLEPNMIDPVDGTEARYVSESKDVGWRLWDHGAVFTVKKVRITQALGL